ncbi:MAG TPA: transporter substrate-binding domain-containing protein [Patescibacteria group bacterium]|nr:transporter substrate-binding domain-containing protein [Patescibacteria group bacterium]
MVVASLGLVPCAAWSETWTVVCEDQYPPYNFIKDGVKTGLDTEVVHAVLAQIGAEEDLQVFPWSRALNMLENGAADMLYQIVATPERREKFILVGPLRSGRTVLVARADSTIAYQSLDDLKPYNIGMVRAFKYTAEFDDAPLSKVLSNDNPTLIRMLIAKRLDLVVGDYNTLSYVARAEGVYDQIKVLPQPLGEVPRYVAFPKDRRDKAERFQQGLDVLRANGTLDKILMRWE